MSNEATNTNPCFCHLNGYEVKDAYARRRIGELETKKVSNETLTEKETLIDEKINVVKNDVTSLETRFNNLNIPENGTEIEYNNTESGLEATNVQDAINEVKELASQVAQGTARGTTYNNTKSGLEATNVQDAIDEVNEKNLLKPLTFLIDGSRGNLVSSNVCCEKDGIIYLDVMFSISQAIGENEIIFVLKDKNDEVVSFNKRLNLIVESIVGKSFVWCPQNNSAFYPNSVTLTPETYRLVAMISK